jgi:putative ABC transport system permease protein
VAAIALVIAIGTGLYTGLGSMEDWRTASNDASFAALRSHDLELSLSEGGFVPAGRLARVIRGLPNQQRIEAVNERLVSPTQVDVAGPGGRLLVPGLIVGSPLGSRGPPIDGVAASDGRGLRRTDTGRPVVVLDTSFAEANGLPATGQIKVSGSKTLSYVGLGRSPEYFLVTRPGGGDFGGAESSFAVLFTSLKTAQEVAGGVPAVNDAVIRTPSGTNLRLLRRDLERALAERSLGGTVTTFTDEPARRVLYEDASGDQELFNIFAYLVLAGAALAAFNLSSRIVEAQRREIGVGMALGIPRRELAIRPMLLGSEIALGGAVFGLILGLLAGQLFRGVLNDLLPLPVMRTPFEAGVYLRGAILGFALPLVATALPVGRGLRIAPIEAIRVGFRSAKSSGLASVSKHLPLPGSSLWRMPLGNFLRAPRRSAMTVLGIAAIVTVVVAFLGFMDSFAVTVDRSEAQVAGTHPNRLVVSLDGFLPARSKAVRRIARSPGVGTGEPRIEVPVEFSSPEGRFAGSVELLDANSRVWKPAIVAGPGLRRGKPGIVISQKAASDLGIGLGDRLTLTHPVLLGPRRIGEGRSSVRVVGLTEDPFRIFSYIDRSQAASWRLAAQANRLAVIPAPGTSDAQLKRTLFGLPGVASVEKATATSEFVRKRLDDFVGILRLTVGFALVLALLIAFNSSSISADERSRESATMLAFGVPPREIIGLNLAESLIGGVLATLIGVGLGLLLIRWVADNTLPKTIPDLGIVVSVGSGSIAAAVAVGVVAVGLAPLLTYRRVRRMDVPSTLRVVE